MGLQPLDAVGARRNPDAVVTPCLPRTLPAQSFKTFRLLRQ
jgi:hypothetical protein